MWVKDEEEPFLVTLFLISRIVLKSWHSCIWCLAECWKMLVKIRLNRFICLVWYSISYNYCANFIKRSDTFMICRANENYLLKLSSYNVVFQCFTSKETFSCSVNSVVSYFHGCLKARVSLLYKAACATSFFWASLSKYFSFPHTSETQRHYCSLWNLGKPSTEIVISLRS